MRLKSISALYPLGLEVGLHFDQGMKEREEYSKIIFELFELVKKDIITTLAICPLNKKKGSFPASLMARMMIYYLNEWVGRNLKENNSTFKLSMIKIVCDSHAYVDPWIDIRLEPSALNYCTWTKRCRSEDTT